PDDKRNRGNLKFEDGVPVEIISARSLGQNTFVRFRVKGAGEDVPDFHCRQRGYFPENPESEVRALVRQNRIFIYHTETST
ncbi:MAG: hypothetical protein HON14_19230, partial [Rhodospirillaceae bacterium]|nr:hypothetical protein [Rhodospirillaceae bacterium]